MERESMESKFMEKAGKIIMAVIVMAGLIYAFYNLFHMRAMNRADKEAMEEITAPMLAEIETAGRLECTSLVYLKAEVQNIQDVDWNINFVHDFNNQRLEMKKAAVDEIFEYTDSENILYSKGVTPVFIKDEMTFEKVSADKWYQYSVEEIYGKEWREGTSAQLSYGCLGTEGDLLQIEEAGTEDIDGVVCTKYTAYLRNSLKEDTQGAENDSAFRKVLSKSGLSASEVRKSYPEIYELLKEYYNQNTVEMTIWADENNRIIRIERDYTFLYYANLLKQNSEMISIKAGQYSYPQAVCRQNYRYGGSCRDVNVPSEFQEL